VASAGEEGATTTEKEEEDGGAREEKEEEEAEEVTEEVREGVVGELEGPRVEEDEELLRESFATAEDEEVGPSNFMISIKVLDSSSTDAASSFCCFCFCLFCCCSLLSDTGFCFFRGGCCAPAGGGRGLMVAERTAGIAAVEMTALDSSLALPAR
jgi:hypothetical protein